jgi:hypothetical protein
LIPVGLKALLIVGGATTATLALAVVPFPPSVEVMLVVVLFFAPAVVPVTFAVTMQTAFAVSVTPLNVKLPDPATAVAVPPHVLLNPLGVEITSPAGSVSVKPTPLSALLAFVFEMLNVRVVEPFSGVVAPPKVLVNVGGAITVRFAVLLARPVPPFVALTAPVVLALAPAVVPMTLTASVHVAFTAIVPPVKLTVLAPATALGVPPHVVVNPLGVATTRPAGNASVNATPVSATVFAAGLPIVSVSDVDAFSAMLGAPNTLLIVGGAATAVTSLTVAGFTDPPLDVSVTLLVCDVAAPAATFTVTVIAGKLCPAGSESDRVHDFVAIVQVQPVPDIDTSVKPGADERSSTTVTGVVPSVGPTMVVPLAALETAIV